MLKVTWVRAALPPSWRSLSRVNQKVMGRATPPPCQGSGNYSQNIPHPEKTGHLHLILTFPKEMKLLKMACHIHKLIPPHSSVLWVHSFLSHFCTFYSTSSCMLFLLLFIFKGIFFLYFPPSFLEILQKYLVTL